MTSGSPTSRTASAGRLVIRVDADHRMGLGHAVRCAGLVEALGDRMAVTVIGAGAVLPSLFPGADIVTIAADNDPALATTLAEQQSDMVVIDHPTENGPWSRRLRHAAPGARIVVIDDWGGAIDADLILNGTVIEAYHHYSGLPPGAHVLAGARYTLLRRAFARTPWAYGRHGPVVVVVGSGDRAAEWAFFVTSAAVDRRDWGAIRLVVGSAFPACTALAAACDAAGVRLSVGLSAPELAAHLAAAPVALITGGMIVYEALAVGVPAVVYPQLANLEPETRWLAQQGCVIDLGAHGGFDGVAVATAVTRLVCDPKRAATMSQRQHAILDGRGVDRAAAAILAMAFGPPP